MRSEVGGKGASHRHSPNFGARYLAESCPVVLFTSYQGPNLHMVS